MDRVRAWVLLTAVGVVAGCALVLTGEGGASWGSTAGWLGRWSLGAAAVSAVAVIGWVVISEARRRRAEQRGVILAELTSAAVAITGQHPGGHTVRVTRWNRLEPRRIVVRYPKKHDPQGAAGRLASALTDATPKGAAPRGWHATHVPLTHRYVLTPKPDLDGDSQSREEAEHRAVQIVKKTIPGCKSVTVTDWDEAQNPTRLNARFDPSPRLSSDRLQAAVVRVVSDSFPGRWVAEWDHEHDSVQFLLRPELPRMVHRPTDLPGEDHLVLRYGVTDDGSVQVWDLDGTQPHGLVIGPTGGGKTVCLRALALDAIAQGVTVYGCDPKRIELMGLVGVPGVAEIATDPESMEELIIKMKELMDERYQMIERRQVTRKELPAVLFILDEFFILRMRLNKAWQQNPDTKGKINPVLDDVSELLALARSARIHLAIGIQRPDAEFLEGAARDNVRHRVALNAVSTQGALMMWENPDVGTDLPDIPGRAVATGRDGKPHEVQVFFLPDPDPYQDGTRSAQDQALLDALLAGAPTVGDGAQPAQHRLQLEPPELEGDIPPTPGRELDAEPSRGQADPLPGDRAAMAIEDEQERNIQGEGSPGEEQWDEVPAEALVAGDEVQIEGVRVELVDVDVDPLDEECVALEWHGGAMSMPASEPLPRARGEAGRQAA